MATKNCLVRSFLLNVFLAYVLFFYWQTVLSMEGKLLNVTDLGNTLLVFEINTQKTHPYPKETPPAFIAPPLKMNACPPSNHHECIRPHCWLATGVLWCWCVYDVMVFVFSPIDRARIRCKHRILFQDTQNRHVANIHWNVNICLGVDFSCQRRFSEISYSTFN